MAAAIWLIGALILVMAEAAAGELFLVMLGGGALITAGTVAVVDLPLWAQGIVFAVASVLLVAVARPPLRRYIDRRRGDSTSYLQSLPGATATVTAAVSADGGRVLVNGEEWSARTPYDGAVIAAGAEVTIIEIDGAVAVVVDN